MAKTLDQILHWTNLTGVIRDPKMGIPSPLPPAFLRPTRRITGNSGTYTKVDGNRKTARLVQYGAPSVRRELAGVSDKPFVALHSFEHVEHDMSVLTMLRNFNNPEVQRQGSQLVAERTVNFRQGFVNLRTAAIFQALFTGANYFDADGNLLNSSSGAVTSVDYAIPSGNKAQLDVFGAGDIIAASWATAGTDIVSHVKNLKQASVKLTGYPLAHAFYGENILGYLLGNTDLSALIAGNPGYSQSFAQLEIPNGFLGLNWHPCEEAFYVDDDGSYQELCGGDTVVFTPEPSSDWWEVVEGSYEVPTSIGSIGADATAMLNQFATTYGMFSYAKVLDDPGMIKHNAGDTFLAIPKVPGAIFQADVTP